MSKASAGIEAAIAELEARPGVGRDYSPRHLFDRVPAVLADQLHRTGDDAVAYDQLVRQLIADKGLWTDAPSVNFVTVTLDQNNDNAPDLSTLGSYWSRFDTTSNTNPPIRAFGSSPNKPAATLYANNHA